MSIRALLKSIGFAIFCALLAYSGYKIADNKLKQQTQITSAPKNQLQYEQFDLSRLYKDIHGIEKAIATITPATSAADNANTSPGETKLYLINLWASWCAPCVEEIPLLEKAAVDFADQGLVVVGLSEDETVDQVINFMQEIPISYPVFMSDAETRAKLSDLNPIGAIPFSLFVNAKGDILSTKLGIFSKQELNDEIAAQLETN